MKKQILILAVLITLPLMMKAQRVELTPYGGYVFAGNMQGSTGDVHFKDNAQYGAMLSVKVSRAFDLDLLYNRSVTTAELTYLDLINNSYYQDVPLSINYMHVGFTKNFRVVPVVSPFIGLNVGACVFAPKDDYQDAWFFSVGMNAGAKIYFHKRIGLKIQAQGMMPIQASGFSMFVGPGGASGGIGLYSTLFQFGFTGGLIFRLG
jgi:hypothetical protein